MSSWLRKKAYTTFLCVLSLLLQEERFSINKLNTVYHVQSNGIWESCGRKDLSCGKIFRAEINTVKNCGGAAATTFALLVWVK